MKNRENKGKSIIEFPKSYISIDVETTGLDYEYDEVIEVSAVKFSDGEIIDRFTSLSKPKFSHVGISVKQLEEWGIENFSDISPDLAEKFLSTHIIPEFIENLTGISNEDILNAPPIDEVITKFHRFIGESVLVGHNVNFDVNFLYDACVDVGLSLRNDFVDTMRLARKLFPDMPHHRLIDITEKLGVTNESAHRAESDALATAKCLELMKSEVLKTQSVENFINSFNRNESQRHAEYKNGLKAVAATVTEFDETNPVFGKTVVFTGALSCMSRKEAFQFVANLGGFPADSITKKTNFLVVGNEDFAKSVKDGKTSKMKKAEKYAQEGLDIVTMSENTFFDYID